MPASDRLIIFARVPETGRAKTRLIPALGPEGAAALHAALTQRTLKIARFYQDIQPSDVEVRFAGNLERGDTLLHESSFPCRPQVGNDLGERLDQAVSTAFAEGAKRVLVIGTDCPDLSPMILRQAKETLQRSDVVLGPAVDGGYYLIGLRSSQPELFRQIDWSTERVLQQTCDRCATAGLSVSQLPMLSDIDHPEDLIICRRIRDGFSSVLPTTEPGLISIVMPTLNEEQNLEQSLRPLLNRPGIEVIIADGGSSDATIALATEMGARVGGVQRGRGRQLNAGAAIARGEVLLFLHADTRLPTDFETHVWSVLNAGALAGAFRLQIDGRGVGLRFVEWAANFRSRFRQMPYGDQAIFMRATDFYQMNGFKIWPLMEDYELCCRLRRKGKILLASAAVTTSDRRWKKLGVLRTTLTNQCCIAAYYCGASPESLARFYTKAKRTHD